MQDEMSEGDLSENLEIVLGTPLFTASEEPVPCCMVGSGRPHVFDVAWATARGGDQHIFVFWAALCEATFLS